MKYLIRRKSYRNRSHKIVTQYYIMERSRKWYQLKPQWNYTLEHIMVPLGNNFTIRLVYNKIKSAEMMIGELCKKVPKTKDIKIIECNMQINLHMNKSLIIFTCTC